MKIDPRTEKHGRVMFGIENGIRVSGTFRYQESQASDLATEALKATGTYKGARAYLRAKKVPFNF